ncbi:MAG: iron-containing redox enzyme family protein [Rhodococcus sp. (in: high G+C Gram-positive bacteria)]|uniref:iron-containing redox enzyme family protein n=1 Tax=Rhodococcus sp. TaxID=1831 RepID=UPI003BB49F48
MSVPAYASLPRPRGVVSDVVISRLTAIPDESPWPRPPTDVDPYGDDAQLALTVLYELHYRGFPGVDPDWEWAPGPLAVRTDLERAFLRCLHADVPAGTDVDATFDAICREPRDAWSVSHHLAESGTWAQAQEYFAHRSIYQLKEADPQAWAIPRLTGRAKATMVAVEFDEYGGGRPDRLHAQLFADLMVAAGLDETYLGYLDRVPALTLAPVNFMSMCGLHRSRVAMLVGQFAAAEMTTGPSARRMVRALRRLDAAAPCVRFYTEHVEADAVHELVLRHDVVGALLEHDPDAARDVVFGAAAIEFLEGRLGSYLLDRWSRNESSLLEPAGTR